MINTICGRRFPQSYEIHQPGWDTLEVRRGNGAVLAMLKRGGGDQWLFCNGWNRAGVIATLDADIAAERVGAMDREAHKRMKAAALNRRKHMPHSAMMGRALM